MAGNNNNGSSSTTNMQMRGGNLFDSHLSGMSHSQKFANNHLRGSLQHQPKNNFIQLTNTDSIYQGRSNESSFQNQMMK